MIDLATITATVARDRVAEQFAGSASADAPAATATPSTPAAAPVRRVAVRVLRTVAARLDPTVA
jgi:hypothetical protein